MQSGMFTIFGTTYYTHGIGLIFVFPFAVWFFITVAKCSANYSMKRKPIGLSSMVLSASISLLVFTGVFLDVFLTGQKASRLCNTMAGLHVYKKVKADGLLGLHKIEDWTDYGFKFVEHESITGKKNREFIENNKVKRIKVKDFMSKFELVTEREKVTGRITMAISRIKNRESNEVFSELVVIGVYPGWADSFFINLTGTDYGGWNCERDEEGQSLKLYYISDLVKETIIDN